jgi:hypothetical protein
MQINLFQEKNIVSSFDYPRREFIKIIQNLKRPAYIKSKEFHFVKCEMIIADGKITMRLSGSEVFLFCDTIGTCKSTFYLRDFYEALKADKNDIITIAVSAKTINVNKVTLTSTTVLLSESSIVKELEAPLDSLNIPIRIIEQHGILNGKRYITFDDKRIFYGSDINSDVIKALAILKKYNIYTNDIEQLILGRLREYK